MLGDGSGGDSECVPGVHAPGADREISDGLCDQHGTGKGDWSVPVFFPGMVTVRLG